MDILHVIHQFPPESRGGSESYVFDISQLQRARGRDVQILTGTKHWRKKLALASETVEGLPVHRLHRDDLYFDYYLKGWHPEVEATIEELLQKWQPKLVHVHHWVRLTYNIVEICHRLGIPAMITLHDYYTSCPRAFRRRVDDEVCMRELSPAHCATCAHKCGYEPLEEMQSGIELFRDHVRAELALARKVLVAVNSTADLLASKTNVPRSRYEILPLGYRQRWPDQGPLPAPAPGERWRFAFWGGVGRHKGVGVLLRAFRQLEALRPGRAELHVLGGFESPMVEKELRALAEGLRMTFHGIFDAAQLRATAPHVGVFPSTCLETYGLVLDECFELGLPCITSDLGALPERSGKAGVSVRAGDESALAAAMMRFLDEPELWGQLRVQLPPSSMTLELHVDKLLSLYEQAIHEPAPVPFAQPVTARRRVAFLLKQRESLYVKVMPPGGPV